MPTHSSAKMERPTVYLKTQDKPKWEWLWLPLYCFGIFFFSLGLKGETSLFDKTLLGSLITVLIIAVIGSIFAILERRDSLTLETETLSYRYFGITFTRRWEDVENFRLRPVMGDTMIICDILRPTGPIDAVLGKLGGWKGHIHPKFDGVDPETLLAQLKAMKTNRG